MGYDVQSWIAVGAVLLVFALFTGVFMWSTYGITPIDVLRGVWGAWVDTYRDVMGHKSRYDE